MAKSAYQCLLEGLLSDGYNAMGIPGDCLQYQKLNPGEDPIIEFFKIHDFLDEFIKDYIKKVAPSLYDPNARLEFINYGDTQLVFVLSTNGKKYSLLITQNAAPLGITKQEFDNLNTLANICPSVIVKPEYYFTFWGKELYIAPYIEQARCIASQDTGYGIYVPEPFYRFELFNDEERKNVNICMIANLIRLYNEELNQGLGSCKIGGGDFILEKSWDKSDKSLETTLKKMKLIAARELITMSFDNYQEQLFYDFSNRTYYSDIKDRDAAYLINHKNRVPMTEEEITKGIEYGKCLRKTRV